MILGDLGAEVIKVEHPDPTKDIARFNPPFVIGEKSRVGALFYQINRNKKSVMLDYSKPEGREILLKLLEKADVLVESFKPGTLERWSLSEDVLKAANKDLVFCSVSGYGQDGPRAAEPGHDMNYLAVAGMLSMSGTPDGPPLPFPIPFGDYIGALNAAIGILAALVQKKKMKGDVPAQDGGFVHVDASIFEAIMSLMHLYNCNRITGHEDFKKGEEVLSGTYPFYRLFKCKDGKYLSLGAIEQKFWDNFCDAINHPELKLEQYSSVDYLCKQLNLKPSTNFEEITTLLESVFIERTCDEWVSFLTSKDICCTPVNDLSSAWNDEHVRSRGVLVDVDDPRYGSRSHLRLPLKFNAEPLRISPAPDPGQNNEEIYGSLKIDAEELKRLKKKRVI